MIPHHPLTRALSLALCAVLFWNPLLSTAANAAIDKTANGDITIHAQKTIDNAIERPHFSYVSAGQTANGLATPVTFNPFNPALSGLFTSFYPVSPLA